VLGEGQPDAVHNTMLCTMRVPIDGLSLEQEEEYPYIIIGGDNGCCRVGSSLSDYGH
jgi:hypothetical protein